MNRRDRAVKRLRWLPAADGFRHELTIDERSGHRTLGIDVEVPDHESLFREIREWRPHQCRFGSVLVANIEVSIVLERTLLFGTQERGQLALHFVEHALGHDLVPQVLFGFDASDRPAHEETERQTQNQRSNDDGEPKPLHFSRRNDSRRRGSS